MALLKIEYADYRPTNLCHVNEKVYFDELNFDKKNRQPAVIMAVGIGRIEANNFSQKNTAHGIFFSGDAKINGVDVKLTLIP